MKLIAGAAPKREDPKISLMSNLQTVLTKRTLSVAEQVPVNQLSLAENTLSFQVHVENLILAIIFGSSPFGAF